MKDVDDEFYGRADAHIHLANDQISDGIGRGKVSAFFMYGMSRFCAYVSAMGLTLVRKWRSIEYFMEQFKLCL